MKVTFTVEATYAIDMEENLFNEISDLLDSHSNNYNPNKAGEEIESFCANVMDLHPESCIEWLIKEVTYRAQHKNIKYVKTLYEA